jgi:hypothetical protein
LTYLVLGSPLEGLPGLSAPPMSELLLAGPPIWIYRIPGAWPRVSLVSDVGTEPTRLDRGSSSAAEHGEPSGEEPSPEPGPTAHRSSVGTAKIESSAPGRVDVATTSTMTAFLLVHDLYYPGWVAEVDGQQEPIVRAGELFRAVEVPPGTHHVTFHFAPFSLVNLKNALDVARGARATAP